MNWMEKFVPDAESCVALFTMGLTQKGSTFVWVDTGIVGANQKPEYRLMRRIETVDDAPARFKTGMFAAFTGEEFQRILPENFIPMRFHDGTFMVIDLYGSKAKTEMNPHKKSRIAGTTGIILSRVNGSNARTMAQAYAQAAIFLIQTGGLKAGL